jgi:HSP20 family molecular chaperone IbpA
MEIDEGPFKREFELASPIDLARIDARYEKGCLWITAPKQGSAK